MFEVIGAYIKNIALLMLLAIFAELLIPNAKIKKYVSVIVGVIMIFTVAGRMKDVLGSISGGEITLPAFQNMTESTETPDIRERLTQILYEEMDEVGNEYENNNDLNIKVEKVARYNEYTNGEVVE
ncbi:MAG: stage III sporulation protein AF [Clostridiales bacterium]|nr:stage III sporulation protein AF [Clostridiales bacterium]